MRASPCRPARLAVLGLAALLITLPAAAGRFVEGLQYQRIDPPRPLTEQAGEADRVELVEMFFYDCPHCHELEPKLRQWLRARPGIDFHRVPAIIGPGWAEQARAYYMARALTEPERLHQALFDYIHEDGEQIINRYGVLKFFVGQGYTQERVAALYDSQRIAEAVNRARRLTVEYGLRGVPAVIVNGRYLAAPYFVRDQEQMLEVLDDLIARERVDAQGE